MKKLLFTLFVLISISMNSQSIDLINPEKNVGITNWYIVNDDAVSYTHLTLPTKA